MRGVTAGGGEEGVDVVSYFPDQCNVSVCSRLVHVCASFRGAASADIEASSKGQASGDLR